MGLPSLGPFPLKVSCCLQDQNRPVSLDELIKANMNLRGGLPAPAMVCFVCTVTLALRGVNNGSQHSNKPAPPRPLLPFEGQSTYLIPP